MAQRNSIKITQAKAEQSKPKDKAYKMYDQTVTGLYLNVGRSGTKTWYINYTNRDNKRQSFRLGSLAQYNVVEIRVKARKVQGDIASGKDPALAKRKKKQAKITSQARTLKKYIEGDYWTRYLAHQKSGKATQKRIQSAYESFLDKDMADITAEDLTVHRTGRQAKGITPQTLNRDRLALHAVFEKAMMAGILDNNPARKQVFPPLGTVDENRVRYLGQRDENEDFDKTERQRFMSALKTMPLNIQTLVGLAMNTGCRRGELFSLTWDRVSLKEHTMTLDASTTKTSKKRTIPLNKKALTILEKWRNKTGKNVTHISGLVFPSEVTGNRMTDIKRSWATLVKRAEVTDFRFHDLRHDFASRLVLAGVPLIEVRDLLGHSSIEMTQRYAHVNPEKLRSAVEVL